MKLKDLFEKTDHLKDYVEKRLFKDWKDDAFNPIGPARVVDDMEYEDQEMFRDEVKNIVTHIKGSKLPLDKAYDEYFDNLEKSVKKKFVH